MPTMYMMIGLPASGKSTWAMSMLKDNPDLGYVSTDMQIELEAQRLGKTYNEVFQDYIGTADKLLKAEVDLLVKNNISFIWDQTNLTGSTRKGKLAKIPKDWKKIAVYVDTPYKQEWMRRLESRPGKTIPYHVLENMKTSIQLPAIEEGFDDIIFVGDDLC